MPDYTQILADIALQGISINTPFRIQGPLYNVALKLEGKYTSDEVTEMAMITINRPAQIESFLLQQKYIEIIDPSTHLLKLTEKGEKAKDLGGHQQYLDWKIKEDKKNKWAEFPKRYWYWVSLATLVIGWFGNVLKDRVLLKSPPPSTPTQSQIKPTIKVVRDTVYIYKIDNHTLNAKLPKGLK